jgi:hypothetical protein
VTGYAVGLLLVGLGWSFGFIGSTVLLADATAPERRARVVGRADLTHNSPPPLSPPAAAGGLPHAEWPASEFSQSWSRPLLFFS